jgi:hypothetical protein
MSRLQSIPFPDGHGPVTQSVDKILIGQGEYNRIARKLDKADAQPGPMRRRFNKIRTLYDSDDAA